MVARSRGGGRSSMCNSSGRKTNPYRPATSQQQEVPACTAIAERGHRGVPRLGGDPENEPAGDPIYQALGPIIRRTQSGERENSNNHRSAPIEFRLGSTPQIQNRQLAHSGECLSLNPHLTWGAVVDLSNFFFNLGLHPSAGRWTRITTEMGDFQWTALPFGLHCSPIGRADWPKLWRRHCATREFT